MNETKTPEQQLAELVLDAIAAEPDRHSQASWELNTFDCGTTRCVGGWALHLSGKHVIDFNTSEGNSVRAGRLLGLDARDSELLFYYTDDKQALVALEFIANGEAIDWAQVNPDELWGSYVYEGIDAEFWSYVYEGIDAEVPNA